MVWATFKRGFKIFSTLLLLYAQTPKPRPKAKEIGAHSLSGAVLDPISIKELIPDYIEKGFPIESKVKQEKMFL